MNAEEHNRLLTNRLLDSVAANNTLKEELCEQGADLKRILTVLERQQGSIERVAKSDETAAGNVANTMIQVHTQLDGLGQRMARMEAVLGIVERETTGAHRLLDAPRRIHDSEDSGRTAAIVNGRRALRDLLNAPGRGQFVFLALVSIVAISVLAYFSIRNKTRVDELEHQGAEIRHK